MRLLFPYATQYHDVRTRHVPSAIRRICRVCARSDRDDARGLIPSFITTTAMPFSSRSANVGYHRSMTKSAMRCVVSVAAMAVFANASAALAQHNETASASLSGEWKVSLYGGHVIPVGMVLIQDGDKVTGTLMMWNGEIDLTGDFAGGKLTVSGVHTPNDGTPGGTRKVSATMQPDGTLVGTFGFDDTHGMKLTAERFNARAARGQAKATTVAVKDLSAFAGKWVLNVPTKPDAITFDVDAKVSADQLTGTLFTTHTGLREIRNGHLSDGALVFEVPTSEGAPPAVFSLKFTDDGSVTGTINGPMGQLPFTGQRRP